MHRKSILFVILFVLTSCTTKYIYIYTGKENIVSKNIEQETYTISQVSEPSLESPELILKCTASGIEKKIIEEEILVKKQFPILYSIGFAVAGIGSSIPLFMNGYTVIGRDIIGLSLGLTFTNILYNTLQKSHKESRKKEFVDYCKNYIPKDKKLTIKLKGTSYEDSLIVPNNGLLKISLLNFSSYYDPNKSLTISIYSPTSLILWEYKIPPKFSTLFLTPEHKDTAQ